VGCKLLERTGKWEDKRLKLTSKKKFKQIEMKQMKNGHLTTKHTLKHLPTICDKVCQWVAVGRLFSPGTPISSTNKTDRHDITEILLKVASKTINQTIL